MKGTRVVVLYALLCAILLACVIVAVQAQGSNCCTPHSFPGCDNEYYQKRVCNSLSTCCSKEWNSECAELVYEYDIDFCSSCGDGFCNANSEDCASCPSDCGKCPGSMNCSVSEYDQQRQQPQDPLFNSQWHLLNTGQSGAVAGNDINVTAAWEMGITGKGIRIAIVDDGLQWMHQDLQCNYLADLSYNFDKFIADPSPGYGDYHGTSCAGVAGAKDNNVCGVGAAFRSSLVGLRLLGSSFSDTRASRALNHLMDEIDIYSNSWGPVDDGVNIERYPKSLAAIKLGIQTGRNGKGSIYIWAAGNGRRSGDESNFDELANSPYTIAVTASDFNGVYSLYAEPGSNTLVSAPSNNFQVINNKLNFKSGIVTTDRLGFVGYGEADCTSDFGGTSSATPLVAGVVALILEANGNLTWRDVQYILLKTATRIDLNDAYWSQNAAGLWFNWNYGFGRVNAGNAVEMAMDYTLLCPYYGFVSRRVLPSASVSSDLNNPTVIELDFSNTSISVEHVQVKLTIYHMQRGELAFGIRSPSGTFSLLSSGRSKDQKQNINNFTFMSVQFWGENSTGIWRFEIVDKYDNAAVGTVEYVRVYIHGHRTDCTEFESDSDNDDDVVISSSDGDSDDDDGGHQKSTTGFSQAQLVLIIILFATSIAMTVAVILAGVYVLARKKLFKNTSAAGSNNHNHDNQQYTELETTSIVENGLGVAGGGGDGDGGSISSSPRDDDPVVEAESLSSLTRLEPTSTSLSSVAADNSAVV